MSRLQAPSGLSVSRLCPTVFANACETLAIDMGSREGGVGSRLKSPYATQNSSNTVSFAGDQLSLEEADPLSQTAGSILHEEVAEEPGHVTDSMRQGAIQFSWDFGRNLKKVPYVIVPDAWANDPAYIERVVDGMNLSMPSESVVKGEMRNEKCCDAMRCTNMMNTPQT